MTDPATMDDATLLDWVASNIMAAKLEAARRLHAMRWIPVRERLPLDIPHGYCLVTDGKEVGTANYSAAANTFYHCIDCDYWMPTHWMPLPAPPEATP